VIYILSPAWFTCLHGLYICYMISVHACRQPIDRQTVCIKTDVEDGHNTAIFVCNAIGSPTVGCSSRMARTHTRTNRHRCSIQYMPHSREAERVDVWKDGEREKGRTTAVGCSRLYRATVAGIAESVAATFDVHVMSNHVL
jgi:hypothetical protein